jgi:circadian clock protein KaiB
MPTNKKGGAKHSATEKFGNEKHPSTLEAFQALAKRSETEKYLLRLYVAGTSSRSSRAIENVRKICEEHLAGRYDLEVIDLYQQPVLSKGEQIVAVPTLIKKLPAPLRKFIGDMSDTDRILVGLDLRSKKA